MFEVYAGEEFEYYKLCYISCYFSSNYYKSKSISTIFKEPSGHNWKQSGIVRKTCSKCSQEIMLVQATVESAAVTLHWVNAGNMKVPESCSLVLMRKALK